MTMEVTITMGDELGQAILDEKLSVTEAVAELERRSRETGEGIKVSVFCGQEIGKTAEQGEENRLIALKAKVELAKHLNIHRDYIDLSDPYVRCIVKSRFINAQNDLGMDNIWLYDREETDAFMEVTWMVAMQKIISTAIAKGAKYHVFDGNKPTIIRRGWAFLRNYFTSRDQDWLENGRPVKPIDFSGPVGKP